MFWILKPPREIYFSGVFLNLAVNPKGCPRLSLFTRNFQKISLVIRGCRAFNSKQFFKQLPSPVVMISLMKCTSSSTTYHGVNYALIKNPSKNIYYGICISFVQTDAGHLGKPLGQAVPLDLYLLGVTRPSVTQMKFVNPHNSQRRRGAHQPYPGLWRVL